MIIAIEEAIKKRIAEAGLCYLRTVKSYAGQFDEGLGQVVRSFPAVWVAFKGEEAAKPTGTSRRVWHVPATFFVMVGARSVQSESAPRTGGVHIGTYQMLADVRALLLQQDFGLPIDHLKPGRTMTLLSTKVKEQGLSIIAQEWHTQYPLEVREEGRVPRYDDLSGGTASGTPNKPGGTPSRPSGTKPPVQPDGTTLPPLPPLADFLRVGMSYYLRPPADDLDEPDLTDELTL